MTDKIEKVLVDEEPKLKHGEIFTVENEDAPPWIKGKKFMAVTTKGMRQEELKKEILEKFYRLLCGKE